MAYIVRNVFEDGRIWTVFPPLAAVDGSWAGRLRLIWGPTAGSRLQQLLTLPKRLHNHNFRSSKWVQIFVHIYISTRLTRPPHSGRGGEGGGSYFTGKCIQGPCLWTMKALPSHLKNPHSTQRVCQGPSTATWLVTVMDKGNGGQPACPEEWKKCKEEHE
jgi:hypothetical protein